ncbi:MAG: hypothetical protein KatS3mg031_3113 [Chitinophagales bacterium]|nr:MAG: hypothetical protein KatS3mg031_3113 [Chitinophagales bacterium]
MEHASYDNMVSLLRGAGYSEEQMEEEIVVSVLGALATTKFARYTGLLGLCFV